jgi:guanylate kinase
MAQGYKRLFIFSAPSGAGKTTIAKHLLTQYDFMRFSISATTRARRPQETHAKDYYFLSLAEFEEAVRHGDLAEHEQIFGNYYGTLRSEIDSALRDGKSLVFDIDVKGALMIFVAPPSMEVLTRRLTERNTESDEQLKLRLERAAMELAEQDKFDEIIVNDDLERAFADARAIVEQYAALPHE